MLDRRRFLLGLTAAVAAPSTPGHGTSTLSCPGLATLDIGPIAGFRADLYEDLTDVGPYYAKHWQNKSHAEILADINQFYSQLWDRQLWEGDSPSTLFLPESSARALGVAQESPVAGWAMSMVRRFLPRRAPEALGELCGDTIRILPPLASA